MATSLDDPLTSSNRESSNATRVGDAVSYGVRVRVRVRIRVRVIQSYWEAGVRGQGQGWGQGPGGELGAASQAAHRM